MNKKFFIGFLIIIIISISCSLFINLYIKNNQESKTVYDDNKTKYQIIKDGYSSYESQIISNYEQYLSFVDYIDSYNKFYGKLYNFNTNKYNEKYFDSKSIAILNIVTGTGMNKLRNIDISINGNKLICNVDIKYTTSQITTDDINGKVILVELDKSVTEFEINT